MSKRNNRQKNRRLQQQKSSIQQLQPQSVPAATAAEQTREAFDLGVAQEREDQQARNREIRALAELLPAQPAIAPRKFGEARVFRLDCGLKITIEADADTLEQEVFLRCDSDELEVLTGDSAVQRRILKQRGAEELPRRFIAPAEVHAPAQRSLSPDAPKGVGGPVPDPSRPYDGIGPPPRDYQEKVLAEVGIDIKGLAAAVDPAAGNMIAELVQG